MKNVKRIKIFKGKMPRGKISALQRLNNFAPSYFAFLFCWRTLAALMIGSLFVLFEKI